MISISVLGNWSNKTASPEEEVGRSSKSKCEVMKVYYIVSMRLNGTVLDKSTYNTEEMLTYEYFMLWT